MESHRRAPHQDIDPTDPNDDLSIMLSAFDHHHAAAQQFFSHDPYLPSYLTSSAQQPQQSHASAFIQTSSLGRRAILPTSRDVFALAHLSRGFSIAPTSPHRLHAPSPPFSRLLHEVEVQPTQPRISSNATSDVEPVDMDFQAWPGQQMQPLDLSFEMVLTAASLESGQFRPHTGYPSTSKGEETTDQASDLFLSATGTSSASSEGALDDCSSQEKDVHTGQGSTSWMETRETQTSAKGKEERKEERAQSGDQIRKKLTKKPKRVRGPKVAIRIESEVDIIDDGYKWRKYGQKALKNSPFSRNYYRCSDRQCAVKKQVERDANDPSYVLTTYEGSHNHLASPTPMQVIHRPTLIMPEAFNISLPLQTELFQMSHNPLELQEAPETRRDQGLLEDLLPMQLRRRSI